MNKYTLRLAAESDMPAIRALIREVHINPTGLYWKRFIIAVDEQDHLVGCGQIKNHGDGSHELASIAVTPTWRGKGVARAIIEHLLAENLFELYLTCRAELGTFYVRFGFSIVEAGDMTPYFRRLYRLASAIRSLRILPGEMLVMKRSQPTSKPELHN